MASEVSDVEAGVSLESAWSSPDFLDFFFSFFGFLSLVDLDFFSLLPVLASLVFGRVFDDLVLRSLLSSLKLLPDLCLSAALSENSEEPFASLEGFLERVFF